MRGLLARVLESEDGQDLIEYPLLIGVITLASVLALISDRREDHAVLQEV